VYPLVLSWLHALDVCPHPTALSALTQLVVALLHGQSLRPSALIRALMSPTPVPARQRYKRVARALDRPWLTSAWLTPTTMAAIVSRLEAGAPSRDDACVGDQREKVARTREHA